MDKLRIQGGRQLQGSVRVSGAKNSALPAMAAALLTSEELVLQDVPLVNDMYTARRLRRELGGHIEFATDHAVRVQIPKIDPLRPPTTL